MRSCAKWPEARFPLQDPAVSAELAPSPLFTVAVGHRLALAVTNDCGTAHMLAAAETPLVSLFGPSAPQKWAPTTPDLTLIRAQDFGGAAWRRSRSRPFSPPFSANFPLTPGNVPDLRRPPL